MTRHLKACAAYHAALSPAGQARARPARLFHLFVEGTYAPEFWLHLDVRATATLAGLDDFLRDLWLECCGHMSAFQVENRYFERDTGGIDGMWLDFFGRPAPPESMRARLDAVLRPGTKFSHVYDFGSSTHLGLKVIDEHEGIMPSNTTIQILARNLLPDLPCAVCGQPAAWLDTFDDWKLYCAQCAEEIDPDDQEGFLPVVNSPRMGVCGYTG